jgi:hypothetical protein
MAGRYLRVMPADRGFGIPGALVPNDTHLEAGRHGE